jgi:processive 1,2-diacylglycerol beta-glucosyltransferase
MTIEKETAMPFVHISMFPRTKEVKEALAKELPLILTSPIPGQEERNVRFLLKYRLAHLAQSTEDLLHILVDLVRHPKKIAAIRQRARLIAHPHSAWEASRVIFDLINLRGSFARPIS